MDNLTHSLVGAAAAKAGLERLSPYATVVAIVAANAPDSDVVVTLAGRTAYLEHHRGITHSIVGTLALAILWPALFFGGERLIARLRRRKPKAKFYGLLAVSLVLTASHPILDWTNSYGVRPFLPWDSRWIYGDLVFIVDPWIWLVVGGAVFLSTARTTWRVAAWATAAALLTALVLLLPSRRGLALSPLISGLWVAGVLALVVAYRYELGKRFGQVVPAAALALVAAYWGGLAVIQARAFGRAEAAAGRVAAEHGEDVQRLAAMPSLANPLRWVCAAETNRSTFRFDLNLTPFREGVEVRDFVRYEKPGGYEGELVSRASDDERARVFLDFARFPVARVEHGCGADFIVRLADLRFGEPASGRTGGNFSLDVPVKGQAR